MHQATLNAESRAERDFTRLYTIRRDCDIPYALGEQGRSALGIPRHDSLFILFNRIGPTPPRRILTPHALANGHIASKRQLL